MHQFTTSLVKSPIFIVRAQQASWKSISMTPTPTPGTRGERQSCPTVMASKRFWGSPRELQVIVGFSSAGVEWDAQPRGTQGSFAAACCTEFLGAGGRCVGGRATYHHSQTQNIQSTSSPGCFLIMVTSHICRAWPSAGTFLKLEIGFPIRPHRLFFADN